MPLWWTTQQNRQRQHCCSCSFAIDIWPCHVFCYFRLCHSKSLSDFALGVDKIFTLLVTFLIRNVAQGNCNKHQNRNAHYNADQYNLVVDALIGMACKIKTKRESDRKIANHFSCLVYVVVVAAGITTAWLIKLLVSRKPMYPGIFNVTNVYITHTNTHNGSIYTRLTLKIFAVKLSLLFFCEINTVLSASIFWVCSDIKYVFSPL